MMVPLRLRAPWCGKSTNTADKRAIGQGERGDPMLALPKCLRSPAQEAVDTAGCLQAVLGDVCQGLGVLYPWLLPMLLANP